MRRSIWLPVTAVCLLALLLVMGLPARADSNSAETQTVIVLRGDARQQFDSLNLQSTFRIDYGSFEWVGLAENQAAGLRSAALDFEEIANPYTLRLAEQSFDPRSASPAVSDGWQATGNSGRDFRLVQFYGPTRAEWLADLEAAGVQVVQYIHPRTFIVYSDAAALQTASSAAAVRWSGEYAPAYKVQPQSQKLSNAPINVGILLYRGADTQAAMTALAALGATNIESNILNNVWQHSVLTLSGDQIQAAAQIPGVYSIQPRATDGGLRGELTNQLNVGNYDGSNLAFPGYQAWLTAAGVDGDGVFIANVDGGIQDNHVNLASRMVGCVGSTCGGGTTSSHGTHTAGIMAADGSSGVLLNGFNRGLGVAPGANLIEQVYSPTFTQAGGMLKIMTQSYDNGASLSGNSWGPAGTPQGYDDDTMQVDIGVRDTDPAAPGNQPLSFVLSFMNGYGGTSSQGSPDEAKNIFNIGSTKGQNNDGSQILDIDDLSANSAHGPALDGRTIPHMVAPGCNVDSTVPTNSYGVSGWCGTSMASPHVSGGVALFIELYKGLNAGTEPTPALIKAAFLSVTHDLAGHDDADGGTLGHPYDSKQGWGRMDLAEVISPTMTVMYFDNPLLFDNSGETWTQGLEPVDPSKPIRMMLVWTDAPGHGNGGSAPAWVNDLDLSVEDSVSKAVYKGNNFNASGWSQVGGSADSMNNTEGIFLGPVPPAQFTITVTATGINGDGVPNTGDTTDQDFAIACYNCQPVTTAVTTSAMDANGNTAVITLAAALLFVALMTGAIVIRRNK